MSEEEFQLTLDRIPGLVCTMTSSGEIEFVNRPILDYFGRTLAELKSWASGDAVHPEDLPHAVAAWQEAVRTGTPYTIEHRLRRADGVYRWFQNRATPVRDAHGQIVRWYDLLTDIEDQHQTQEALRASEKNTRLILDSIAGLVTTHSGDGELELFNAQFEVYTGKALEVVKHDRTILHPDDRERVFSHWRHSLATGDRFRLEARLRRADGVFRWFDINVVPVRNADDRVIRWYSLITDIDDRKSAEEALQSAQSRLSRATQLAAVSELAASIAHEVNQPLAAVVANADACVRWLSADPPNLAKAYEAARQAVQDGLLAGDVVERVRALFKRGEVEKNLVDLNQIVGEVLRLFEREVARRSATVEMELTDRPLPVLGDRRELQQVVINLVLNGLEAMDTVVDRPRRLFIRSRHDDGDHALVEIRDHGMGLKDPDKAFEAFFTTKENGLGMGLSICRSIISAHGGRLWAASGEEPGATLCFCLPLRTSIDAGP